ncbi:C4-dicarboxylate transporter DcuC [Urbifossiella limnaea]|uniref:Cryptic C4-dicarboxylate transporter DcuD n=1 Tax=Urbifossiella limnaea TaxID=2528023 RepID=A0A517XL86_9BACT|nr:C4-dicarboxylate transporter DcuC [Urbifossiella limnaea]QDU18226.1 Putative cryptic C4-dicarboxylate transporter DcuD [Urbifossiella limnaea]
MGLSELAAVLAVVGAVVLVVRGWDVRLVLLAAALLTATASDAVGGRLAALPTVVLNFLATFSNEKFVVPICTAMGFAYVLRHTGCERHLVLLLTAPLRRVRWLLVPGVVLVGFLVNIPVISQTSTAVCLGPVIVPLMRAAGYSFATIGACLLLGASVGGELLNPGAPELLTVASFTNVTTPEQVSRYLPGPVFVQLAVALAVIWVLSAWWEKASGPRERAVPEHASGAPEQPADAGRSPGERVNFLKAAVPLVPLVLLFLAGPPLHALDVPDAWVAPLKAGKRDDGLYSTRLIGLAMLVGVLVAMAVTPGRARDCVKQFFDGAGYGFANIVSLIVTATCFGKAIEGAGLAALLGKLIAAAPGLLEPLAAFVPLAFGAVSGSGMASTQSLYGFFYQPALDHGHDPTAVGALVGVGSAAGRTMSPVSAVTLMCATLTFTSPFVLAKRVALPLLAGTAAVVALRMAGVV